MILSRSYATFVAVMGIVIGCTSEALGPAPALMANQTLRVNATVTFLSTVEGGCWALSTLSGRYEPVDLPQSFRVDGRRVRVVLRDAPGWASICMVGALVHVDSISAR
jgi:hypothetical protein